MKDYLRQQVDTIEDTNLARCITREYLQARLLECLQENGAFVNWVFVGGTALRVSQYDWDKVVTDAHPFIERRDDLQMLTMQNVMKLLETTS